MADSATHSSDNATRQIARLILSSTALADPNLAKKLAAIRLGIKEIPTNTSIIDELRRMGAPAEVISRFRRKPVRTRSGVTIITVAVPLFECPHGRCVYCPGGGSTGFPQSYTGREPVVSFARQVGYDVKTQVRAYVERLKRMGHNVDKVELIFIGGTYTSSDLETQRRFVKDALDGLHNASSESVWEAVARAEHAYPRVVGMMVETRPDWCSAERLDELVRLGVTRVELGVQALDDEIYRRIARGHTVMDVVHATRRLRDRAFKVGYHFMPGLPGSSPKKDLEMYRMMFSDPRFRPDALKIYPTMVIPGTPLYELWRRGEYSPYPTDQLVDLLVEMLSITPPYVRIHRIRREIPSDAAADGRYPGNLREIVEGELRRRGLRCLCVRCREVGRAGRVDESSMDIRELRYETLGGREVLLTYETEDGATLAGLLRLRLPDEPANDILRDAALVRELHVYGEMAPVGRRVAGSWQHRRIGARLLAKAEETARGEGYTNLVVISGLGVKEYYAKRGYSRLGPYMAKRLS
jgi:elongator complex protein 3